MPQNNSINPKIINNMQAHYSELIKNGATSFGDDAISKSVFSQIDKNPDGTIDESEVTVAKSNLQTILQNAFNGAKELAEKMFSQSKSEQMIQKELDDCCNKLFEYAKNNPDDEIVQQYANKLKEIMENGGVIASDTKLPENFRGLYYHKTSNIFINSKYFTTKDDVPMFKTLLHEIGHSLDGDGWDSIAEERDVEIASKELYETITGEKLDMSEGAIEEFLSIYKNYPKNSPGHNGLPKYLDFVIGPDIESIKKKGKKYLIKTKVDENGKHQEILVTLGKEKAPNGDKLPEEANFKTFFSDGMVASERNKKYKY